MLLSSWEALFTGPGRVRHLAMDLAVEQPAAVLRSVLDDAVEQDDLILVVDCGDHTVTPELAHSLDHLVRGGAGGVRIVLLTRSDPHLPLHRYRLDGTVTEIRAADLAFTTDEATALMRHQKLTLAPAEMAELRERTDGWPAGLMFAAMSLAGKTDTAHAIREFRGDSGNVAAYLMSEVLDGQPPALREFLLRTSIVDHLQPTLAEALTGCACDRRSLEFISHGNAFIQPVPGTDDAYSYQPLFREFLRAQLQFERPALVPQLHRSAAGWFAHEGRLLAAIRHAIAARRWDDAARYLVDDLDVARLLVGRERRHLETLFADLPADLEGVEAAVVRAARAVAAFDLTACASELGKARRWLDRDGSPQPPASRLAITVLQAVTASLAPNVETALDAALTAEAALRATPGGAVTGHPELRMLVAGCKGRVLLQRGDFPAAAAAFAEGAAVAEGVGLHESLADFLGMSALVEALWGHLRQAGEIAAQATALAESRAHLHEPRSAIVAQAWVRTDQGDLPAAQALMQRAGEAQPTYDARVLETSMALVRARLLRAGGDADLAGAELRAARNSYEAHSDDWLGQTLVVDEAKILVAEYQPYQALSEIERSGGRHQLGSLLVMQRAATETGRRGPALPVLPPNRAVPLDTQVDSWLVQAAEAIRTGDTGRTRVCLERALRLAAPEHLRRPFSEAPPSVRRLLGPTGDLIRRHPWLRAGGGSGEQPRHGSTDLIRTAALTGKEHEVLEYLAELLTTEEIASTMYVSVNTVRSHVRSVLRKLNASRRNEAVRRAWELGLLPTRPESGSGGTVNTDPLRAGPGTQYGSASASSRARTARP